MYLPDISIVMALHTEAGGTEKTGITKAELGELHSVAASAKHCDECFELRSEAAVLQQQASERAAEVRDIRANLSSTCAELDSTRAELSSTQAELDSIRKEAAALREGATALKHEAQALTHEVQALKAREARALKKTVRRTMRAGQRSRLTARGDAAQLPVPPSRGDRQLSNPEKRAALSVALQVGALQNGGRQDRALSLLRHSAEVLSPAETATLVFVLRESQLDELAGTLIHIYGRDNSDPDVMQAAARLHQHGAPDDAAALLQAALSTRTGRP
ncbi:hypothetical protein [Streptomyces sp. AK04-3B]|uniref:hypothetical protein n=1 Tax=Streptomyces sp. AK04-3B TaxID=3028650 RepID=UPI0029BF966B|nr:hypothetical protein [Streptomyces sp. AK04-3B]MDX3801337.1 hypothetical protein [Streptomyces sp. AK04-3B]